MKSKNNIELIDFLNSYNACFLNKDMEKIRNFYSDENNELIYFDNHKNNDTYSVDDHLELLSDFFLSGKKTESGQVEEILVLANDPESMLRGVSQDFRARSLSQISVHHMLALTRL